MNLVNIYFFLHLNSTFSMMDNFIWSNLSSSPDDRLREAPSRELFYLLKYFDIVIFAQHFRVIQLSW